MGGADEGLGLLLEVREAELTVAVVQQFQLEPAFGTKTAHRGGLAELHHCTGDAAAQLTIESLSHGPSSLLGAAALLDRRQTQVEDALIGAAVPKGAPCIEGCPSDQRLVGHHLAYLVQHQLGLLQSEAIGQDHNPPQLTVVLLGDEGFGQGLQAKPCEQQAAQQQGHHQPPPLHSPGQPAAVGHLQPFQPAPRRVDPTQQPGRFASLGIE